MITAAVVSSRWVLWMRPVGCASVSVLSPITRGMTATPVSNPDSPRASFGNSSTATPTMIQGLPWEVARARCQSANRIGCCIT